MAHIETSNVGTVGFTAASARAPAAQQAVDAAIAKIDGIQAALTSIQEVLAAIQEAIAILQSELGALQPPNPSQYYRSEQRSEGEPPNERTVTVQVFDSVRFNADMGKYQRELNRLQRAMQSKQQELAQKEQELAQKERELAAAQQELAQAQQALERALQNDARALAEAQRRYQEQQQRIQQMQQEMMRAQAQAQKAQEELQRALDELQQMTQCASVTGDDPEMLDGYYHATLERQAEARAALLSAANHLPRLHNGELQPPVTELSARDFLELSPELAGFQTGVHARDAGLMVDFAEGELANLNPEVAGQMAQAWRAAGFSEEQIQAAIGGLAAESGSIDIDAFRGTLPPAAQEVFDGYAAEMGPDAAVAQFVAERNEVRQQTLDSLGPNPDLATYYETLAADPLFSAVGATAHLQTAGFGDAQIIEGFQQALVEPLRQEYEAYCDEVANGLATAITGLEPGERPNLGSLFRQAGLGLNRVTHELFGAPDIIEEGINSVRSELELMEQYISILEGLPEGTGGDLNTLIGAYYGYHAQAEVSSTAIDEAITRANGQAVGYTFGAVGVGLTAGVGVALFAPAGVVASGAAVAKPALAAAGAAMLTACSGPDPTPQAQDREVSFVGGNYTDIGAVGRIDEDGNYYTEIPDPRTPEGRADLEAAIVEDLDRLAAQGVNHVRVWAVHPAGLTDPEAAAMRIEIIAQQAQQRDMTITVDLFDAHGQSFRGILDDELVLSDSANRITGDHDAILGVANYTDKRVAPAIEALQNNVVGCCAQYDNIQWSVGNEVGDPSDPLGFATWYVNQVDRIRDIAAEQGYDIVVTAELTPGAVEHRWNGDSRDAALTIIDAVDIVSIHLYPGRASPDAAAGDLEFQSFNTWVELTQAAEKPVVVGEFGFVEAFDTGLETATQRQDMESAINAWLGYFEQLGIMRVDLWQLMKDEGGHVDGRSWDTVNPDTEFTSNSGFGDSYTDLLTESQWLVPPTAAE